MSDMLKSSSMLETVSTVDALYVALRDQILDGSLSPGTSVAEVDVAREFHVSRPSAKAAIRALVFEGLLRHEANRAARVATPSAADVIDLFLARIPLELAAVNHVSALDDDRRQVAVQAAREGVRALRAMPWNAPHSRFVHADLLFHQQLVDATTSGRLSRIYACLRGEIHLCMVHTRRALGRDRIVREHAKILDSIQVGDGAAATRLMHDHLIGARDALVKAVQAASPRTGAANSAHAESI